MVKQKKIYKEKSNLNCSFSKIIEMSIEIKDIIKLPSKKSHFSARRFK